MGIFENEFFVKCQQWKKKSYYIGGQVSLLAAAAAATDDNKAAPEKVLIKTPVNPFSFANARWSHAHKENPQK